MKIKVKQKWVTKKCENKYENKNKNKKKNKKIKYIQNMYAENNNLCSVLQYY